MAPGARRSGVQRGGKKGDVYRIGGVDLPWDPQLDLDAPRPTPLQPESKTLPPKPLSVKEKREVHHFLSIRDRIRKGPLHAVLGGQARVSKHGGEGRFTQSAATFDAFNGMVRYSSRYAPKKNALPQLHSQPFVKEFFPRELWGTIDPAFKANEKSKDVNMKGGNLHKPGPSKKMEELTQLETDLDDERDKDGRGKESEGEEVAEEEADVEYDEEDDGGDYDAEHYFNDGGDDAADDNDAGEDGGIDYF